MARLGLRRHEIRRRLALVTAPWRQRPGQGQLQLGHLLTCPAVIRAYRARTGLPRGASVRILYRILVEADWTPGDLLRLETELFPPGARWRPPRPKGARGRA